MVEPRGSVALEMYHMTKIYFIIAVLIIVVQIGTLFWLGNSFICPCGLVKLWGPIVKSPENSQHLFDWYSFSHIVYGIAGYFLVWPLRKKFKWAVTIGFLLVLVLSVSWEILENTAYVVHHYQTNTISFDYYGDSVVNSLVDTLSVAAGFWLAYFLPVWAAVALALGLEILTMALIRDGLVLNTIMFVYPLKSIVAWQAAIMQ